MDHTLKKLGTILKEKREEQNLTTHNLSQALKIKKQLIEAIEDGDFSNIPGRSAYTIGFLRSYAKALNTDENVIIDFYKQCDETNSGPIELKFPEKINDRSIASNILIITCVILAIVIYIFWKTSSHNSIEKQSLLQNITTPVKTTPQEESDTETEAISAHSSRLILLAKENTWIKIEDSKKQLIHEATLQSGDTFFLPEKENITVIAGNSDAIEIFIDNDQQTSIGTLKEITGENHD